MFQLTSFDRFNLPGLYHAENAIDGVYTKLTPTQFVWSCVSMQLKAVGSDRVSNKKFIIIHHTQSINTPRTYQTDDRTMVSAAFQ